MGSNTVMQQNSRSSSSTFKRGLRHRRLPRWLKVLRLHNSGVNLRSRSEVSCSLNSHKKEHQLKEAQFQEACNKKINEETTGSAKSAIEAEAKAASDAAVDEKIQKHKK